MVRLIILLATAKHDQMETQLNGRFRCADIGRISVIIVGFGTDLVGPFRPRADGQRRAKLPITDEYGSTTHLAESHGPAYVNDWIRPAPSITFARRMYSSSKVSENS